MSSIDEACARWVSLSDREALGESLSAEETAFSTEHPRGCDACRREASVWQALGSALDDPSDGSIEPPIYLARAPRRQRRRLWMAAGVAAAAAALILAARGFGHRSPAESTASGPAPIGMPIDAAVIVTKPPGAVLEVDGHPAVDGEKLARGSEVVARRGSACLLIEPSIRACIAEGSAVRTSDLGAHRRLELRTGRVSVELDPLPLGHSFGITTAQGSSIAIGTAFSVEVLPGDGRVVTRVMHGKVLVRALDGREQKLAAHEQTSMRDAIPSVLPAADEEKQRALLVPSSGDEGSGEPVAVAAPQAAVAKSTPPTKSASELLLVIRERRAEGDLAGAALAYRELFERHRPSAQAHAALVSWGDLQLSGLDDPSGALVSFERYLARGGPLEEEAAFGRARALRALGRVSDERSAIESFLARFGSGPLAPALRDRLRSLDER